jgi:aryl-alcohol dehydrogenase-like predicted oxidoreductase
VRVPFDEGALAGRITPDTEFEEGDFRNDYFHGDRKREVYERVQRMAEELSVAEDKIPEIALRYILSHPAVSTVIPGMRSVRNVESNMAVADGKGLPTEQVQKLNAHHWVRNFYPGF